MKRIANIRLTGAKNEALAALPDGGYLFGETAYAFLVSYGVGVRHLQVLLQASLREMGKLLTLVLVHCSMRNRGINMGFTLRLRQILQVMLNREGPISVKLLAESVDVSRRTVQRELEYVQSSLKGYEIQFKSRTGVGVWLEGSQEEKMRLLSDITGGDTYDAANREDRRKRLILEILKEKGLKKLYYYSSQFKVSEATISGDLEAIASWLEQQHLHIVRKPGSGIMIEGSEENYRRAIRIFIDENMDTPFVWDAYDTERERLELVKKNSVGKIMDDEVLRRVVSCITEIDAPVIDTLTQNSYTGLILHVAIAVDRILKNELIEERPVWMQGIGEDRDYKLAEQISRKLEAEFQIQIPEVETAYICLHLKGAKHEKIQWNGNQLLNMENRDVQTLINEMIDAFDSDKAYLLRQDDEFIQGLLAHLQPTLVRILHDMQIQNPVLEDIKANYPDIFKRCTAVAEVLCAWTGKTVPDEEIGYLTVHFGAGMVRLQGRTEKIRRVEVGVVCSSGIGISRLMTSKLEKTFKDRIQLHAYGKGDITPCIAGKTDFFISSISLENIEIPVIYVNPLLKEEDIESIRRMIYKYQRMPEKNKRENRFSAQMEEINVTAAQINLVIKYMEFFKVDNAISFEELLIAGAEKLSPYSDRRERIREDIMRREEISTQVFAEFGFALLHAKTAGVIRPSFTVCMTKDLKPFTHPYFKGITAVFIMLLPVGENEEINRGILGHISTMLVEDRQFMDVVSRGDKEEIRDMLSRGLKKYFTEYLTALS